MELFIIVPIGGILVFLLALFGSGIYAIYQAAVNHQQIFFEFANTHSDTVLLISFIASLIASIIIAVLYYSLSKNQKKGTNLFMGTIFTLLCSLTSTASIMCVFCYFISWTETVLEQIGDGIIMVFVVLFMVSPLLLLLLLFVSLMNILPNILNIFSYYAADAYSLPSFLPIVVNIVVLVIYWVCLSKGPCIEYITNSLAV
ncbi:MAG: hypothetical protein IJA31_00740 [Clostridia bacterium]|nr:hypothetical protein [Clostridia bacterium]